MQERTAEVRNLSQPPSSETTLNHDKYNALIPSSPRKKSHSFKYFSAVCVKALRAKLILSKYQSMEGRWSTTLETRAVSAEQSPCALTALSVCLLPNSG